MKLTNGTKGNTAVIICFRCTKEIKHEIFYNIMLHVDELTKVVQMINVMMKVMMNVMVK